MVIEIVQREIATRNVGYIILRDCPEDRLAEGLNKGMEKLKKAGAQTVLATSLPEGEPLNPGPVGVWRLTHAHDIIRLEKPLTDRPKPELKLTLRPLKRAADDKLYLELVNRAFQNVPNAATQRSADLRRQNHRYSLAYRGDQLVGACELDLSEKVPELCSIAILPELQRQGLGRSLLRTALETLGGKPPACFLTVSTGNLPAVALYESEGFARTGVVSSWYQVV